jgi:hypothetical protein
MSVETFNRRDGLGAGVIGRRTAAWPARSRGQFRSRGNQAPSTLQIAPEAGTDVVRRTPVAAGTRQVSPADRLPAQ